MDNINGMTQEMMIHKLNDLLIVAEERQMRIELDMHDVIRRLNRIDPPDSEINDLRDTVEGYSETIQILQHENKTLKSALDKINFHKSMVEKVIIKQLTDFTDIGSLFLALKDIAMVLNIDISEITNSKEIKEAPVGKISPSRWLNHEKLPVAERIINLLENDVDI
jgi:hypothetical protein